MWGGGEALACLRWSDGRACVCVGVLVIKIVPHDPHPQALLALDVVARGGVYIASGLTPRGISSKRISLDRDVVRGVCLAINVSFDCKHRDAACLYQVVLNPDRATTLDTNCRRCVPRCVAIPDPVPEVLETGVLNHEGALPHHVDYSGGARWIPPPIEPTLLKYNVGRAHVEVHQVRDQPLIATNRATIPVSRVANTFLWRWMVGDLNAP